MAEHALELINEVFSENEEFSMVSFLSAIRERFLPLYSNAKILNAINIPCKNGELVRFRGIIYNSHGFELFASKIVITNEKGEQLSLCGAFQNDFDNNGFKSTELKNTCSRYVYNMGEIPGETDWMVSDFLTQNVSTDENVDEKRRKIDKKRFIIKLYEDCDNTLLPNTMVDLYGIYQSGLKGHSEDDPYTQFSSIHVINHTVIDILSLVPRPIDCDVDAKTKLMGLLSLLLGSEVAAHYLLSSLVSKTYSWREELNFPLCSLPLNVINVQNENIITAIKLLMPMVQVIEVTRELLENEKLYPVMDHETEILSSSPLQLCRGSVLILDMTKFEMNGENINLKNNAVDNILALKALISEQKILYDYKFYKHPLETDIITIVLSKIPWKIVETPYIISLPNPVDNCLGALSEIKKIAPNFRHFIMEARNRVASCLIPPNFQRVVCEDFTELRRIYREKAPDHFKHLLTLTRLMSVIENKPEMDIECYKKVLSLESSREAELNNFLKVAS